MNIMVVSGYCLKENISANLSHNALIQGLMNLGHTVDIICYSEENLTIDKGMEVPAVRRCYAWNGVSLYEKLAGKKQTAAAAGAAPQSTAGKPRLKARLFGKTKKFVRSLYGIYNPSIVWFKRAKRFSSKEHYDCVISMSYPQVSHLLCGYLLRRGRLKADRWIQLWEDPWSASLGNGDDFEKSKREEAKLLRMAEEVVYVTPVTLSRQQELFPESKDKMRWCPLASYYKEVPAAYRDDSVNHYGYFGDYFPNIRNLKPFYDVAVRRGLHVEICGRPVGLLRDEANVRVFPRLPLDELKKHEDRANIAVCLFNLGGGQVPGKIYQLAATDKVILAILDGPMEEQKVIRGFFEKFNRFIFCQNNEASIAQAVESIEKKQFGKVINRAIDDFNVTNIAGRLLGDE